MCPTVREYRCTSCKKLFFKGLLVEGEIEIKCRHCHSLNRVSARTFNDLLCLIEQCPNRITFEN